MTPNVDVEIELSPETARAVLNEGPGEELAVVLGGAMLAPRQGDASPPRWWYSACRDRAAADLLATRLRSVPGVVAAYVKPEDEPP